MRQYIVDAFTDKVFSGNPAAICIMDKWIPERLMMDITKENSLSETAFAVKEDNIYKLRWFTPGGEIDLCGHATLGTAFVIMNYYDTESDNVIFDTLSGRLSVKRNSGLYEMDFPSYALKPIPVTPAISEALGAVPAEAYIGRDLLCVFEDERTVRDLSPDMAGLSELDGLLVHVTSKGSSYDCISRSFGPKTGIIEDPVCGSGHCHIIPYWSGRLGKKDIVAYQASKRGGTLYCRDNGDRIMISGNVTPYAMSELFI